MHIRDLLFQILVTEVYFGATYRVGGSVCVRRGHAEKAFNAMSRV